MVDSHNAAPGGLVDDQLTPANSPASIYGTPTAGDRLPTPTSNRYGSPGSSGLDPSDGGGTAALGNALMESGDSTADLLKGDPNVRKAAGSPQ